MGTMDILSLKEYSIDNIRFRFGISNYDEKFGLYEFDLRSIREFENYSQLMNDINRIHEIVLLSYLNYADILEEENPLKKISESYNGLLLVPLPSDNGNEIFIKEYTKKNISLKLGYYIKYYDIKNENGKTKDYKKHFVILLNFSEPDMKQQRRKIEQQTKNEIKEKEAKKF